MPKKFNLNKQKKTSSNLVKKLIEELRIALIINLLKLPNKKEITEIIK